MNGTPVIHHKYDVNAAELVPLTKAEYQLIRSGKEIKHRPQMESVFANVWRLPPHKQELRQQLRQKLLNESKVYLLDEKQTVKVIGYRGNNGRILSTKTARADLPCITDGMGPCIGIVIAGEKINGNRTEAGAQVRVFHAFARNTGILDDIVAYVEKLKNMGLSVKFAMHGGMPNVKKSRELAEELRTSLKRLGITEEFDETCEKRGEHTSVGAVIGTDNKVYFVKHLAVASGSVIG